MKLLRLLIVPALALALNVVVSAGATHAQTFGDDTFDINSYNWYCTAGSTTCNPAFVSTSTTSPGYFCSTGDDTCNGLNYAAIQASGDMTGTANGTPGLVTMTCVHYTGPGDFYGGYVNVSTNNFYDTWGGGAPGYQADDPWVYNFSHGPWMVTGEPYLDVPSQLSAKATILSATEDAPNATSSVTLSAYDAFWHQMGTVTGVQNTDNETDTPLAGQFRITITGMLWEFRNYLPYAPLSGTRTVSCTAGGPQATAIGDALVSYYGSGANPWATGSYGAEGETEDYPLYEYDHNCAYAPLYINDPFKSGCENLRGIPRG